MAPSTTASSQQMNVDESSSRPSSPAKLSKRKNEQKDDASDDEDEGTDTEMLDVSFDFFDPQPQDYHSVKLLLTQLLSHDSPLIDIPSITNLILDQKLVGSTVKTDGADADPYAVLSVLNLNVHKSNPAIESLTSYLLKKLSNINSPFSTLLTSLLSTSADDSTIEKPNHIGLVVSERLVNMPAQVVPPMYRMLQEELQWAREDKEPYHFSHLLFLSRVFMSSAEEFEEDSNAALNASTASTNKKKGSKKTKTGAGGNEKRISEEWLYHAEDEMIKKAALYSQSFAYSTAPSREGADPFGVETRGLAMLVEYDKFDKLVEGMEDFLGPVTA